MHCMRRSHIIAIAATIVGCFIYALGVNLFYVPHQFMSGGITGIAMIVYYLTGLPIGTVNMVLNIPLLFLAWKYLGKFYTFITIFGTFMVSFFIDALAFLPASNVVKDPLLAAICGGFLIGVGSGVLYRYNSNSGGFDVVAAILKKYYNIEMGTAIFAVNCIIVAAGAFIFTLELGVCTLVGMYIASNVTNRVVIGFGQRKAAFIVSSHPLEISDMIIRHLGHSATLLYGQGAFTGGEKEILFAIVNLTQIARMKQLIRQIDPSAFLFIMNTTDVIGRGFTMPTTSSSNLPPTSRYCKGSDGRLHPTEEWQEEMEKETVPWPFADDGNESDKEKKS